MKYHGIKVKTTADKIKKVFPQRMILDMLHDDTQRMQFELDSVIERKEKQPLRFSLYAWEVYEKMDQHTPLDLHISTVTLDEAKEVKAYTETKLRELLFQR